MRILYLLTDSNFGGTEASVFRIAEGMKKRGHLITICSIKRPGFMADALSGNDKSIKLETLNLPPGLSLFYPIKLLFSVKTLKGILKRVRPDIVHSFLFQANLLSSLVIPFRKDERPQKIVYIHSLRCIEREKPQWKIWLDRMILKRADEILTVSEAVRQKYIERERIALHRLMVLYNGIDEHFIEKDSNEDALNNIRESYNITSSETIIGTLARLHPDKGIDILIKGFALSLKVLPGRLRLIIVGGGPEDEMLKGLSKGLGIEEYVIFTGFQADVKKWLSLLDIFCLTSREEGLPQSILEAMSLGKPVIAANVGGVNEIIENNVSGLLIEPNNPQAFCDALIFLFRNPAISEKLGKAGPNLIRNKFLLSQALDRLEMIYSSL